MTRLWVISDTHFVHGHIHERPAFGPNYVNVSVEQTGYAPVLLESLRREVLHD